jgi:hypothetical protein
VCLGGGKKEYASVSIATVRAEVKERRHLNRLQPWASRVMVAVAPLAVGWCDFDCQEVCMRCSHSLLTLSVHTQKKRRAGGVGLCTYSA